MPRDTSPARGVPPGYHAVTPWVISRDTPQLIEFTKQAFGAAELARISGPAGGIGHAEVRIGDSVVMMFDAPEGWPGTRPSCACMSGTATRPTSGRCRPGPPR